ncbi:hypothetical protein AC249_AIPGENE2172 [Exaiptasia diaphana]|nr:hypothetical protein AC249_AIPGENE2172 [Exaiptasia diaphana]
MDRVENLTRDSKVDAIRKEGTKERKGKGERERERKKEGKGEREKERKSARHEIRTRDHLFGYQRASKI